MGPQDTPSVCGTWTEFHWLLSPLRSGMHLPLIPSHAFAQSHVICCSSVIEFSHLYCRTIPCFQTRDFLSSYKAFLFSGVSEKPKSECRNLTFPIE